MVLGLGFFVLLWIVNLSYLIYLLIRTKRYSAVLDCDIPAELNGEVGNIVAQGYKVKAVEPNAVVLVKAKKYFFPWLLMPILPNGINVAINSGLVCSTYGVKIEAISGEIKISTF